MTRFEIARGVGAALMVLILFGPMGCKPAKNEPAGHSAGDGHNHGDHAAADSNEEHDHGDGHSDDDGHDPGSAGGHGVIGPDEYRPGQFEPKEWCYEHGVPEEACTRCNPGLIAKFQASLDWCGGHGLPESQCLLCNPDRRAYWASLVPHDDTRKAPVDDGASQFETLPVAPTDSSDPLCLVEQRQIRFIDSTIAAKAGIETSVAAPQKITSTIECPAEVQFNANRLAHVTPRVAGILVKVSGNLGDKVEPGDVLAVCQSPMLGEAKSRYIELYENFKIAHANLDRHEGIHSGTVQMLEACTSDASMEQVREVLADVRVGEDKHRLLKSHAVLHLARLEFERQSRLSRQEISSKKEYETSRSELQAALAEFDATREAIRFESDEHHMEMERQVKVARSAMEAAKRRLLILGSSENDIDTMTSKSSVDLSRYELVSPVAGTLVERHAVAGEAVREVDRIFTIADTESSWLMLDVRVYDLVSIRLGQRVLFIVDGLEGHSFEGRIEWIAAQVDEQTRTVKVRASIQDAMGLLRANMFGRALIVAGSDEPVLAVPIDALQTDGCCRLVFVQQADNLYMPRKVTTGAKAGGLVAVLAGLREGERVVTTGSFLMKTEILKANIGAGCCEVDPGR